MPAACESASRGFPVTASPAFKTSLPSCIDVKTVKGVSQERLSVPQRLRLISGSQSLKRNLPSSKTIQSSIKCICPNAACGVSLKRDMRELSNTHDLFLFDLRTRLDLERCYMCSTAYILCTWQICFPELQKHLDCAFTQAALLCKYSARE